MQGPRDRSDSDRGSGHQPPQKVDDMRQATADLLLRVVRLLLPAKGRHRAESLQPESRAGEFGVVAPRLPCAPVVSLRGEDVPLVRPYLGRHELWSRQGEVRRQRARRRALWCAVHGIDVGPRWIHGVEVAT